MPMGYLMAGSRLHLTYHPEASWPLVVETEESYASVDELVGMFQCLSRVGLSWFDPDLGLRWQKGQ